MLRWNAVSAWSIFVIDDELDNLEIVLDAITAPVIILACPVIGA